MNTLPEINILQISDRIGTPEGLKPGNSTGNDIFQSILDTLNGRSRDSNWISTLYSDTSTQNSNNPDLKSSTVNLNSRIGSTGITSSGNRKQRDIYSTEDLVVPSSLQNQLVTFLEKQGFSLRDINEVLSSSKNSNGFIQLDKLLAGLSGISLSNNSTGMKQGPSIVKTFKDSFSSFLSEQGIDPDNFGTFFSGLKNRNSVLAGDINDLLKGDKKDSSFIESSQIPAVQEQLFNMGLGVGDVKNIIEKSKNGKGELELDKLSAQVNKFLSPPFSESDLASLFSKNNISVNERLFKIEGSGSDKSNLLTDSVNQLTDKAQTEFKQKTEVMLKEKGIQEENIKSLLEKLDAAFTKINLEKGAKLADADTGNQKILSALQGEKQIISGLLGDSVKEDIAAFLKNRGSSDKDIKSFLDSFSLNVKKINTGQDENYLKSSLLNEKTFGLLKNDQFFSTVDQGNLKLNLSELLTLAEKKANAAQEGNIHRLKSGSTGKDRSDFILKEPQQISGLDISQGKEIKNTSNVNQTNTAASMPDPLPRIADKMLFMIRTGEYKGRLQITPPELGKLYIELTIKNGHIHANLGTENTVVKEIIEANLNQLKQQLNSQGLTVDRFDVMVGLDDGKREDSNTWAEGRKRKGYGSSTGSRSDIIGEIPVSSPVRNGLISESQIDVHV